MYKVLRSILSSFKYVYSCVSASAWVCTCKFRYMQKPHVIDPLQLWELRIGIWVSEWTVHTLTTEMPWLSPYFLVVQFLQMLLFILSVIIFWKTKSFIILPITNHWLASKYMICILWNINKILGWSSMVNIEEGNRVLIPMW